MALERVGAQRAAQPAHHRGGREPLAGHVAHHEADPAARDRDHVVPVAAHLGLGRGGPVARRDLEPGQLRAGDPAAGCAGASRRCGARARRPVRDRSRGATRSAASRSRSRSSSVKWPPARRPPSNTPVTSPSAISGTPISELTRGRAAPGRAARPAAGRGRAPALAACATRPAKPSPKATGSRLLAVGRARPKRPHHQPLAPPRPG